MMSRQYETVSIVLGASMLFGLLALSFVGIGPSETLAQEINASNAASAGVE